MADKTRIIRMLQLMKYLSGNTSHTVDELAGRLHTSNRSVYRYMDNFKEAGFAVNKICSSIYCMPSIESLEGFDISKLVYFTEEEAYIVNSLIDSLSDDNALKNGLKKKLVSLCEGTCISEYIGRRSNATNVACLASAIKEEKKVILHGYDSSHSGKTRDRIVEPFGLIPNDVEVWAFDLEDSSNKLFRVSRIESVEILDESWTNENLHQKGFLDPFRMASFSPVHVRFSMSLMAYNLLLEEFPMAEKYVSKHKDKWVYDGDISMVEGVGRFVIGLAAEIQIIDSPALSDYVSSYYEKYVKNQSEKQGK